MIAMASQEVVAAGYDGAIGLEFFPPGATLDSLSTLELW